MREILFRGKEKLTGKWREGSLLKYPNAATIKRIYGDRVFQVSTFDIILETVGQYTGMTDKNGKKIFAGDIISTSSKLIGAVEWNDTFAKYIVCYNQISGNWFDFEGEDCFSVALDCVIIGNVHDNPELLEGKKHEYKIKTV